MHYNQSFICKMRGRIKILFNFNKQIFFYIFKMKTLKENTTIQNQSKYHNLNMNLVYLNDLNLINVTTLFG